MDRSYPPPTHDYSPRRQLQLQGPRPAPLRLSKDSHKIRKPPPAPRDPVIIYTISPKVIHVDLADFMGLVQRLTGPENAGPADQPFSPAAKLATIQNATVQARPIHRPADVDDLDQLVMSRPTPNPGILSPVPASLPPVSPCFFSPSYLEPSFLNFLHDLSPVGLLGSRPSPAAPLISTAGAAAGNLFGVSPGKFLSTPLIPSPGAAIWDLFKQFKDT
ncbi:protein MKS1 [Dendrobium catenatum]|uniref:Protein MKS1 n=1 Tax=Dendrobium catenatum TaxID=906689 RepID=A0A2I0X5S5_9ASPA|nr:protein MKS1 [Dendrobium catenatum]PKU83250.1 Protein MKS1 [Dendrobium catenatum]